MLLGFFRCWSRVETAALLLDSGADPFAKSKNGDDALQIACLKGFHDIYRLLTSRIQYSTERLANANELIGNVVYSVPMRSEHF